MATKPLSTETIALTEKKMDMTLDDIIKMSKTNTSKTKNHRPSNKNQRFPNGTQGNKSFKVRQYMESRSAGVLAQRRSDFKGSNLRVATEAAQKVAVAPNRAVNRNRAVNHNRGANWNKPRSADSVKRQETSNAGNTFKKQQQSRQSGVSMSNQKPKTLDSLFANMKEQRMKTFTGVNNGGTQRGGVRNQKRQARQPWLRGRFGNYQIEK